MTKIHSLFLSAMLVSTSALAQDASPFKVQTELKGQYLFDENRDLGTLSENSGSTRTMDARLKLGYEAPSELWSAYFEGGFVKVWGVGSGEDDTGKAQGTGRYAELKQSWVQLNDIGGVEPLSVQIGRQRISEPYAFLWNQDTDAVRVKYDTTTLSGFFGVAEDLASYRTSGDDFLSAQDNITNYLAELGWAIDYHNLLELRALHTNDHSGKMIVGSVFDTNHRDDTDENLTWVDLRSSGAYPTQYGPITNLSYRMDGAVVVGDVSTMSSSSIGGSTNRTVNGYSSRDVLGFAFDTDMSLAMSHTFMTPTFTLGYAYGSGDDGTGKNTAFRQPDLSGNSSKQGISSSSSHNYGEVLRADLSNLHILKFGVGVPVHKSSDLSLTYRSFWLDNTSTGLTNAHIDATLNGKDSHVGQEIDMVYAINLDQEIPAITRVGDADFKITLGAFRAGDAYTLSDTENSFRGRADLRFRF